MKPAVPSCFESIEALHNFLFTVSLLDENEIIVYCRYMYVVHIALVSGMCIREVRGGGGGTGGLEPPEKSPKYRVLLATQVRIP